GGTGPRPSTAVGMSVPSVETLVPPGATVRSAPARSARFRPPPAPAPVPEPEGPADVDEGPTGESAAFPPHAATATIIAARMIRFMTPSPPGKPGAIRVPGRQNVRFMQNR